MERYSRYLWTIRRVLVHAVHVGCAVVRGRPDVGARLQSFVSRIQYDMISTYLGYPCLLYISQQSDRMPHLGTYHSL
jgi:hypothetical protein